MVCKLRSVNFRRVSDSSRAFLPAFRVTRSADDKPGGTRELRCHVSEHHVSQYSCLGKSSVSGTLLVCLDIIATTNHSTIFKTHVFSCIHIYVSI